MVSHRFKGVDEDCEVKSEKFDKFLHFTIKWFMGTE